MARRLPMTPELRARITAAFEDVNPDEVAAFETEAINSLPVNKRGSIFDKAVHTAKTLQEMAAVFNTLPLTTHVPLHMNHDQGYGMPIGQVFHAGVIEDNGVTRLRSQFYLPLKSEAATIDKLDTAVINEVSIGGRYKALNCSQCGWNFLGEDATDEHIWTRTCENGHTIGQDGTHLMLNGLDTWLEQSLVSRGAAQKANIQAKTRALLGETAYNALAASGIDPSRTTLFAGATQPTDTEKPQVDLTQLVKELTDAKVLLSQHEATIAGLKASEVTLTEQVKTLTTAKTEAEAKLSAAELEVKNLKETDTAKLNAETASTKAFIRKEADRLSVALGVTPPKADADIATLTASIEENRVKMGHRFQPEPARTTEASKAPANAFKTR